MVAAQGRAGRSTLSNLLSKLNFSFGSGGRSHIGLSIGTHSMKVAELSKKGTTFQLKSYGTSFYSQPVIEQREIVNSVGAVETLKLALKGASLSSKEVVSALTGSGLIVKNLSIQVADPKELQDQVFWEAEQYIPFEISEVVLDFEVLGKNKDGSYEVILVAAKKDQLESYMSVIENAGLKPRVMDAEYFALQNIYEANYGIPSSQAVLIADVGALSTKVVVLGEGKPLLVKDTAFGGAYLTQEIQKDLKLSSPRDAEALKVSANPPQEIEEVIARVSNVLGSEIKKTIDFYNASSMGPPISAVYLSGGGCKARGLSRVVEENVGLPTQLMNPFLRIEVSPQLKLDQVASFAPELAIPMGLAIRGGEA